MPLSMGTNLTTTYVKYNKFMRTSPASNFIHSVWKMYKRR